MRLQHHHIEVENPRLNLFNNASQMAHQAIGYENTEQSNEFFREMHVGFVK